MPPMRPKVFRNYVGLHPMTVTISIFGWGLIIDGVTVSLFAVSFTSTLKVLLTRSGCYRHARNQPLPIEMAVTSKAIQLPAHCQRNHEQV